MNYKNIHDKIIQFAQNRTTCVETYYEKHHIIPLSLGGPDELTNIVKLTAKEHFVIHHLLWRIHRNPQMTKAFMLMCNIKRDGVKYKVSSKEYKVLKEDNRKCRSEFMSSRPGTNLGRKLSQEWRDNISKSQIGISRGKGNVSQFKGKKHTDEAKRILSKKLTGNKNRVGLTHSEETKKAMSANRLGKTKVPWTDERKAARSVMMHELHKKRTEEKARQSVLVVSLDLTD